MESIRNPAPTYNLVQSSFHTSSSHALFIALFFFEVSIAFAKAPSAGMVTMSPFRVRFGSSQHKKELIEPGIFGSCLVRTFIVS